MASDLRSLTPWCYDRRRLDLKELATNAETPSKASELGSGTAVKLIVNVGIAEEGLSLEPKPLALAIVTSSASRSNQPLFEVGLLNQF